MEKSVKSPSDRRSVKWSILCNDVVRLWSEWALPADGAVLRAFICIAVVLEAQRVADLVRHHLGAERQQALGHHALAHTQERAAARPRVRRHQLVAFPFGQQLPVVRTHRTAVRALLAHGGVVVPDPHAEPRQATQKTGVKHVYFGYKMVDPHAVLRHSTQKTSVKHVDFGYKWSK